MCICVVLCRWFFYCSDIWIENEESVESSYMVIGGGDILVEGIVDVKVLR